MGQRMKDQKLRAGLARNEDFVKGEGLEPQVIKLYGSGGKDPSRWAISCVFFEKNSYFNAIWITFCIFSEPFKKAKFMRFESQLKKSSLYFRSSPKHV